MFADYLVTVRETFQVQLRVKAVSQEAAKRAVLGQLRVNPAEPPGYLGDPDELPRSIRVSAVAAWEDK